jgi:GTPase Era involved in 16S rRNA processing
MLTGPDANLKARIKSLRSHIKNENPLLVEVVNHFCELDKIAYKLGILTNKESYTTDISWWPLISVLGTFSAGKSTFINHFVDTDLQKTGNQAVDDKFTVICYSSDDKVRVLPGLALDSDPRFPFYQISDEIEKVSTGEGSRIDSYLQLKTCPTDTIKGKILIDSPGFDADAQRTSTLRITDHIINLSDLVLVLFDARHPEPGAMRDTLEHLVAGTVRRNDANKVLFVLNQIDTTAGEDNAEEVVAAWQRALASGGLVSGRFYSTYNEDAAVHIEDQALRERYQRKRDNDLGEIYQRISEVSVERVYRIIGSLENTANQIENNLVPKVQEATRTWAKRVLLVDALVLLPVFLGMLIYFIKHFGSGTAFEKFGTTGVASAIILGLLFLFIIHQFVRGLVAKWVAKSLPEKELSGSVRNGFLHNTRWWQPLARPFVVGWNKHARGKLLKIREDANRFVQQLNDEYTNPSGQD